MQQRIIFVFLGLAVLSFFGCSRDPLKVDVDGVKVDIEFVQMDSILWNSTASQLPAMRSRLSNELGEIYDYHFGYVMQIGAVVDTSFVNAIEAYRSDPAIIVMNKEVTESFKDLKSIEKQLELGYLRIFAMDKKWGYPKQVVFHNSMFQSSVFCTETQVAIGLERYLGVESPTVKSLPGEPFYDWIKLKFDKQFLVRDAVFNWVITNVVNVEEGNVAERMINYGKALFITEAALENVDKHIIVRYNQENYDWALANEASFWKFIVDQKMLFKTDERTAANYFNDGPFTAGLPEVSPDRLGQFLGWRIVQQYMKKNKVEWNELLAIPYNKILQNYKVD